MLIKTYNVAEKKNSISTSMCVKKFDFFLFSKTPVFLRKPASSASNLLNVKFKHLNIIQALKCY